MIIKRIVIILVCICWCCLLFAQKTNGIKVVDGIIYDINNCPLLKDSGAFENSYWYAPVNGKASKNIRYKEGQDVFDQVTDSLYYSRWMEFNETEINSYVRYVILFDSSLKIVSVKILQRDYVYLKNKSYYDKLLIWIMQSTEGKWEKTDETDKSKYFFYVGRFHMT